VGVGDEMRPRHVPGNATVVDDDEDNDDDDNENNDNENNNNNNRAVP
jgi:hypothetical protein